MKNHLLPAILAIAITIPLFADSDSDEVFRIDIPVYLGEELFRERLGLSEVMDFNHDDDAAPETAPEKITENDFNGKNNGTEVKAAPLGLVFSGGAARAFAHIGVLRKLEEEGIFPDFIVANSMGSIVALLYAAGASPDTIEKMITEYPTDSLFRPELPLNGGVLDTSRFTSMLYRVFGSLDIKELKIPVAIISEDLETRRQIVFMEGDFYRILQASISMPFSFPPVKYMGMSLIDGGVTNLVPVDAADRYTDRIIVSTALYNVENRYTNPVTIINRAIDIGKTRKGVAQLKAIDNAIIRCDVESFSFMDFQKMDIIIDRGYESASDAMGEIKDKKLDYGVTWDKTRFENLSIERQKIDEKLSEVTDAYRRTGMVKQKELSGRFFAGFEMYSGTRDDYYLDNSDYIYLGQYTEISYLQTGVREYYAPGNGYGIDGRADFALFELLVFRNRLMAQWNTSDYDRTILYNRLEVNITDDGGSGFCPFLAREVSFGKSTVIEESESFTRGGFELYAGNYLLSPYWFNECSDINGFGLENDFKIKLAGKIYLDQRSVYRKPFENGQTITLYRNDGLRGYDKHGEAEEILVTNNSLTFRTEACFSFGEILLVKNLAASVFCDYYSSSEYGISTGLSLDLNISFIGLTSLYFTAYAGYDHAYESMFGSVVIGNGK